MSKHVIASLIIAGLAGNAFAATADTTVTTTQTARLEASRAEPDRQDIELAEARTADDAKAERSASRVEFRKDRQGLPRWWN
ncbi:hypothetical protein [Stutzerimonas azotifigens]|uniref:Uncharacterized protein n=1 Tax=Stutzerimonas azotifigens TaxID=291995 RepID=A0ABR5YYH9_9GAMM|nr:hypothetical protein [Stutzerimonas azotifigens]MBA1273020.1 hypothetical protein [Stutzerimonas azotifigens]